MSFLVKLTERRIIKHHQDYVRKRPSEHIQDTAESLMLGVPPCLSQAESLWDICGGIGQYIGKNGCDIGGAANIENMSLIKLIQRSSFSFVSYACCLSHAILCLSNSMSSCLLSSCAARNVSIRILLGLLILSIFVVNFRILARGAVAEGSAEDEEGPGWWSLSGTGVVG